MSLNIAKNGTWTPRSVYLLSLGQVIFDFWKREERRL